MSAPFLREVCRWYDGVMPVIARFQHGSGGPVAMMQVCNEVGVFQWLSGKTDYSDAVAVLYREFLKEKHRAIEAVNALYGTNYAAFSAVDLPRGAIQTRNEYRAYYDFHLFYRHYFALYLDALVTKIRSFGITKQLTHNIPGWIDRKSTRLNSSHTVIS